MPRPARHLPVPGRHRSARRRPGRGNARPPGASPNRPSEDANPPRPRELPLAAGLALADHMTGRNRVTCCFFGDGAFTEGEFHAVPGHQVEGQHELGAVSRRDRTYHSSGAGVGLKDQESSAYAEGGVPPVRERRRNDSKAHVALSTGTTTPTAHELRTTSRPGHGLLDWSVMRGASRIRAAHLVAGGLSRHAAVSPAWQVGYSTILRRGRRSCELTSATKSSSKVRRPAPPGATARSSACTTRTEHLLMTCAGRTRTR
ncbi:thiamine pyrophosphate-dependent enzyme [Streptomyces sp. Wh19]|uniref:thiamine pyrophosphate-dependent enzyme n=1 Tax=Streptomyces sp. Wh19 TaxID=3076629 RepID=UPI003FA39FC4